MKYPVLNEKNIHHYPPWQLQGEGYILNYWISPNFIKEASSFYIAPSPLGRVVQVILVRYQNSPVGPYDEILILDHPLLSKRRLSSIPTIYVSTLDSVVHGQHLWGIPKKLADFEWQEQGSQLSCTITYEGQSMQINIDKPKSARRFYMNSHHIPNSMLTIHQAWQGKRYQFAPKFRGHLSKIKNVEWHHTDDIFPDFNKARYLQSFYVPNFNLVFPEAKVMHK
ncbi:hypothetical protein A3K93_12585 [Acinetobacter sp. NCu2D-2]|uniref:acetoacetate decarboxylase family protein n=1 Tax=Acinetobacter sp. NCu2D-2 TaxID=1608473 RepID=UPI0007CDEA95|nr:acetoacetate decarboxylase family protein [Acinetobacter sp. NCu2D-2]ANF82943.1 hypothetical protein A3K93_12585 [Acinetobacter sp. NCu2D-2]